MFVEAQYFNSAGGDSRLGVHVFVRAGCGNARASLLRDVGGLGWRLGLAYQEAAGHAELHVRVCTCVCVLRFI